MTESNDEKILARAREIAQETGKSLTDAMLAAELELTPKAALPSEFTVTVKVKPRVARWILEEFGGHKKYPVEERLGAYLETVISRARVTAIQYSREAPEITDDGAVSMRRDQFREKAPQG